MPTLQTKLYLRCVHIGENIGFGPICTDSHHWGSQKVSPPGKRVHSTGKISPSYRDSLVNENRQNSFFQIQSTEDDVRNIYVSVITNEQMLNSATCAFFKRNKTLIISVPAAVPSVSPLLL